MKAPERFVVGREPYDTRGIALDRGQIAAMALQSYWEQRTFGAFETSVEPRLSHDAEERDAVLSVLWSVLPGAEVTAPRVMVVPVAARASADSALLYRFSFDPPATRGERSRVQIELVSSGAGSTPWEAPAASSAYAPGRPAMTFSGFPNASGPDRADAYFATHPAEHRALFQWLETAAPPVFDQVLTTSAPGAPGSVTHRSVFHVSGSREGTTLGDLRIDLVSEGVIEPRQSVRPDYRSHDLGDLELERLRTGPAAVDRLGPVTLDARVPAAELLSVKEAIRQYFEAGHARDTEVHTIVPVGASSSALYELSFGEGNAVTVTRIGEAGNGPGQVDVERIDVTRVNGFPGAGASAAALRSWWQRRYPSGGALGDTPPGTSAAALIGRMNLRVASGIASPGWFDRIYGVATLDAAATAARLVRTHGVPRELTLDTLAFDGTDRLMLELSLETLADGELSRLRGIEVGRKASSVVRTEAGYRAGEAMQCGATLTTTTGVGRQTLVLYFGSLYGNNASLFRGSTAAGALPDVVMTILHELGHALGEDAGVGAAFHDWIQAHPQTAPTWYAASAPDTELFPEAFALYHTEPDFLRRRYPLLRAWFGELARTNRTPPARETGSGGPETDDPRD